MKKKRRRKKEEKKRIRKEEGEADELARISKWICF